MWNCFFFATSCRTFPHFGCPIQGIGYLFPNKTAQRFQWWHTKNLFQGLPPCTFQFRKKVGEKVHLKFWVYGLCNPLLSALCLFVCCHTWLWLLLSHGHGCGFSFSEPVSALLQGSLRWQQKHQVPWSAMVLLNSARCCGFACLNPMCGAPSPSAVLAKAQAARRKHWPSLQLAAARDAFQWQRFQKQHNHSVRQKHSNTKRPDPVCTLWHWPCCQCQVQVASCLSIACSCNGNWRRVPCVLL